MRLRASGLPSGALSALATLLALPLSASCGKQAPNSSDEAPIASSSARSKPLDRLAPNELAPGESEVFGLKVPRGMTIQGKFSDLAIVTGRVKPEAVSNYVREHVDVDRVEIGSARTIFPAARIKQGAPERSFRIEIVSDGPATRLLVRDITPPAPADVQGLSPEELWRRAGFSRDGKPLDPKALE